MEMAPRPLIAFYLSWILFPLSEVHSTYVTCISLMWNTFHVSEIVFLLGEMYPTSIPLKWNTFHLGGIQFHLSEIMFCLSQIAQLFHLTEIQFKFN